MRYENGSKDTYSDLRYMHDHMREMVSCGRYNGYSRAEARHCIILHRLSGIRDSEYQKRFQGREKGAIIINGEKNAALSSTLYGNRSSQR